MKTFDLPSNSNYGDQPIPIAFPDNSFRTDIAQGL